MTIELTDSVRVLADGLCFPECPRWRDGWLYFSDMHGKTVYRVTEAGVLESVCEVEHRPGGLGFTADGDMLVVSMDDSRVLRLTAGKLVPHADLRALAPTGVNDLVVGPGDVAYAGQYCIEMPPRHAPLMVIRPDGTAGSEGEPLAVANGIVISADGTTLVVAESAGSRLTAFDIGPNGALSRQRVFANLPAGYYPDGICGDDRGGIWVTCCRGPGVVRVVEGGAITHLIPMAGERFPYACALGGADGRTLFICSSGPFDPTAHDRRDGRIETIRVPFRQSGIP